MLATAPNRSIPFVRQQAVDGCSRTCAAASLAMVYGSFGIELGIDELWRSLSPGLSATQPVGSHRLAADAIARGLPAVVLRSQLPWRSLRLVEQAGWRCIVNHRLEAESTAGHFSVVVGVDEHQLILHDPYAGPSQQFERTVWLDRWRDGSSCTEHTGNVLVAIGQPGSRTHGDEMICPGCHAVLPLANDIGVAAFAWDDCWECLFCPYCDAALRCGHETA